MAATSPSDVAADLQKPRPGRPPLLAKSAQNRGSLDRFLKSGSSSSASTSASSASVMSGHELASSENQNPNVAPLHNANPSPHYTSNGLRECRPKSENVPVSAGKQVSRGRPRKVPSVADSTTSSQNVAPSHGFVPNTNPISAAVDLKPISNSSSENVPNDAGDPLLKKAGRGRPRKKERVKPDTPALNNSTLPISGDIPASGGIPAETAAKDAAKMARKGLKRKRTIVTGPLDAESRISLVKAFKSDVASLIRFYHEDGKIDLTNAGLKNAGRRAEIALLLEESCLPFSSLVTNLFQQLRVTDDGQGGGNLTPASLRSIILSIGERISYGTPNPDADVLEDDSEACLWCWEVRDIKLLPEAFRNLIANRRRKRNKIAERIAALSVIIAALSANFDKDQDMLMLEKAEEALIKTENEDRIRAYASHWQHKTEAKVAVLVDKAREKEVLKEQHRLARETEKKQRRLDKEGEKEKKRLEKEEERRKMQQEKQRERLEKEAGKQRAKEALRQEKELKRQQEEAEKEQKRKEKEEADLRQKAALKKQANIMGRFLQSKKDQAESGSSSLSQTDVGQEASIVNPLYQRLVHDMDHEMLHAGEKSAQDLLSNHLMAWKKHHSLRSMKMWGQRRLPKLAPVSELRLQGGQSNAFGGTESHSVLGAMTVGGCKRSRSEYEDIELGADKSEPEWDDPGVMDFSALLEQDLVTDSPKPLYFQNKKRKLLQFDKSHRPAYYGSFSKKSDVVRPRNPLRLDPNLDYEVDSDEEWEEEDPGESLSDCEKDEDDEKPDPDEDEEAGDGFFVPDGYLSESEGACVEESDSDSDAEHLPNSLKAVMDTALQPEESHDLLKFARQRKALEQLTDHALRCNRPYIICNFHQSSSVTTIRNTDRLCLEALRVCPLSNDIDIEVPEDPQLEKVDDDSKKSKQRTKKSLPQISLREMVEVMLASSGGMKRLVDLLSTKFPAASRSQLKDKVKEVAEFTDNHWQVKKEILEQLGIPLSCPQVTNNSEPVSKSPIQLKPITKFFSKRCLPPEKAGLDDTSPMKAKESCCAKSDTIAGANILPDNGNSRPSVQSNNPIKSN